jgi:hypothetical protein
MSHAPSRISYNEMYVAIHKWARRLIDLRERFLLSQSATYSQKIVIK